MSNENNAYFEDAKKEQWRGDYHMAIQYYQRAIQMQPDRGEIYWEMSISLAHLGRSSEANAAQEKAAQLDPHIREMVESRKAGPGKLEEIKKLRSQGPGSLTQLLVYVNDANYDVKKAAKETLEDSGFKVDASIVEPLIQALKSSDEILLTHYTKPLARIGEAAVESLIALLTQKNEEVVAAALDTLGQIGDPSAVTVLLQHIGDKRYAVALAAFAGLKKMKPKQALEPVMKLIREGEDPWKEPTTPVDFLGELGDKRAYDLLVDLLNHQSIATRGSAISALGKLGDKQAIELLEPFLKSDQSYLRAQATRALSNLGDTASEGVIKDLAKNDPDNSVRRAAEEAIGKFQQKVKA